MGHGTRIVGGEGAMRTLIAAALLPSFEARIIMAVPSARVSNESEESWSL